MERLFVLVLFIMAIGSAIRLVNLPLFYMGAMVLGASIAVLNVLLPSLIVAHFPEKIGLMTTVYTTTMGLVSALASMIAVPITELTSWRGFIWELTTVIVIVFLVWLPNFGKYPPISTAVKQENRLLSGAISGPGLFWCLADYSRFYFI